MSRFKKHTKKGTPGISTSSLPDIIFMLLFFFMVTTTMREATLKVQVRAPQATEVQKLEKKSLVSYIYIGPPLQKSLGTDARIQLADQFAEVKDVKEFILKEREAKNEADRPFMITSLKVDETTRMGIVTDVKQELRQVGAFKINYSSKGVQRMDFN